MTWNITQRLHYTKILRLLHNAATWSQLDRWSVKGLQPSLLSLIWSSPPRRSVGFDREWQREGNGGWGEQQAGDPQGLRGRLPQGVRHARGIGDDEADGPWRVHSCAGEESLPVLRSLHEVPHEEAPVSGQIYRSLPAWLRESTSPLFHTAIFLGAFGVHLWLNTLRSGASLCEILLGNWEVSALPVPPPVETLANKRTVLA